MGGSCVRPPSNAFYQSVGGGGGRACVHLAMHSPASHVLQFPPAACVVPPATAAMPPPARRSYFPVPPAPGPIGVRAMYDPVPRLGLELELELGLALSWSHLG